MVDSSLQQFEEHLMQLEDRDEKFCYIVSVLAKKFSVTTSEIAIMLPDTHIGLNVLRFQCPDFLRDSPSGYVLTSSEQSLAAQTARDGVGSYDNLFTIVPHTAIFETIIDKKDADTRPEPIQKILSVPLHNAANPNGVIQVSRKGMNRDDLDDFNDDDLRKLVQYSSVIGKNI